MPLLDTAPVRSCLCVPADDPRKLTAALASTADQVVVDLEDAVAVDHKELARTLAVSRLSTTHSRNVVVRINGLSTEWWEADLEAVVAGKVGVTGLVLPKAEVANDVRELESRLDQLEVGLDRRLELHLLIESAVGLLHIDELLSCSRRTTAVILGYADLAVSLQRPVGGPAAATWLAVQNDVLVAARAHGVRAIDGPWFDFRDAAACDAANAHAAALGFDGKWVIHPSQIGGVNAAFTPSVEEVAWARRILDAFEISNRAGVFAVDGAMVDKPVVEAARLVLAKNKMAEGAK